MGNKLISVFTAFLFFDISDFGNPEQDKLALRELEKEILKSLK